MKKQPPMHESFQTGEKLRKQFGERDLAEWSVKRRVENPATLLRRQDAGRLAPLLELKYQRMCTSPFIFFRGTAAVMAADLALTENTGITTQLCGDAHVQNLGAYTGVDGRLIFDINDFDETYAGPFEWDVKRMAASILVAGRSASMKKGACARAAKKFLSAYCGLVHELALLPVLETARFQVHRLAGVRPISKVLRKAERSTPLHTLESLTEATADGIRFKSQPPLLQRVTGEEADGVLDGLAAYTESLLPERRHFFRQFKVRDVAFKVVGTGSVGLRDYCLYMEGNGSIDPLFLQIKQEVHSVYASHLPAQAGTPVHQGQRVVEGQRAMQIQSDPLLGWTTIREQDYLVRQLNDHKAAIDVTTLSSDELTEYGIVCGEMLARGHARSGNAHLIAGFIGDGKQFQSAILTFAEAYARQTVSDWKDFVEQRTRS